MESDISLEDSFSQVAEKVLNSNVKALKETHSLLLLRSGYQHDNSHEGS